jgi:multiple sugar transport system permease protein/putative chitobiose transport system permease protein
MTTQTTPQRVALALVAAVIAALFLLPLLWIGVSSLRKPVDIFRYLYPLSVRSVVPDRITLQSWQDVLGGGPFPRALLNSLFVSVFVAIGGVLINALAAFGLAALRFRFRQAIFALVIISFMVPFDVVAIPLAQVFRDWGLQNTYAALVLPSLGNGFAIFLLRQFFLGIPAELRDAARLDGAGWLRIFWQMYLPLSRAALVGAGLMLFLGQWNAYLWPLLIATAPDVQLAPVALASFAGQYQTSFGAIFAGSMILSLVPATLLLVFQRTFTQSIAATGRKL